VKFVHQTVPQRVVFGAGSRRLVVEEAARAKITRALVIATSPNRSAEVEQLLGSACAAVFSSARMHTPVETTDEAMASLSGKSIDGLVAVGGGSAIGLAKAIALRTDLPQIVLPTTYAGSEMTDVLGETTKGLKQTRRDPRILAEVVIYDADLTRTLPTHLSITSGVNAIAHAVEALYARDTNPLVQLTAEEGIVAMAQALPAIVRSPADEAARERALYGAWLCGSVLGATAMALHHKLCHVLGGTFGLPHSETHAVLLPHVVAFNAPAAPDAIQRVARALGAADPAAALFDLLTSSGVPSSLRTLGLQEEHLARAADVALAQPYWNPRPLERDGILALLNDAWQGRRPHVSSMASR
jgi:alcohol dehydrogenase class IV